MCAPSTWPDTAEGGLIPSTFRDSPVLGFVPLNLPSSLISSGLGPRKAQTPAEEDLMNRSPFVRLPTSPTPSLSKI